MDRKICAGGSGLEGKARRPDQHWSDSGTAAARDKEGGACLKGCRKTYAVSKSDHIRFREIELY
jgi:hypothetical protein